ncbi:hypothetical protein FHP29_18970 [Nocardioides albidus]|uniref:Sulfotransferase family protein n=1 Tax=Nocardioides albidus TaxID=1517589 RepID=A0A5C4VKB1_9ACTN|nr:hypothetical protein [Nocardioides albidus]TNM36251.1 hypothetical protein FHP29_18970 [Nocardioides albidus]
MSTPSALPAGARLLHIGLPKTGTTALQASFHAARAELAQQGVHYASKGPNPLRVARYAAGTAVPADAAGREALEGRWRRLSAEFRDSRARVTVLSSEAFSGAAPERVDAIAEALGADATVVVTLRPVAALLPSHWQQAIRHGATEPLEEWLGHVLDPDHPFAAAMGRYAPETLLATWGRSFSEDRMVFVCGDPQDRQFNHRTFEALLGIEGVLKQQDVANSSPPYAEIELLRHLNLAHGDRGSDERWTRVLRRAGRRMGDTPPPGASAERLQLPRWAVERINETAQASISALRASGAVVVGDPANLISDPDRHPVDVRSPEAVSLEMAGWFAQAVAELAVAEADEPAQERVRRLEADLAAAEERASRVQDVPASRLARALAAKAARRLGLKGPARRS